MAARNNAAAVCRVSGITDGDSNDKKTAEPSAPAPPQHKGDNLMSKQNLDNRQPGVKQYNSPLARDLESCTASLAALAGRVGAEEWTEISLIRMQIRALAGQVEGLLIPDNEEAA